MLDVCVHHVSCEPHVLYESVHHTLLRAGCMLYVCVHHTSLLQTTCTDMWITRCACILVSGGGDQSLRHRISTARKEKAGSRLVFSLIEPNWPLPYITVRVPGLRDAWPAYRVTYCSTRPLRKYNAESPKQGSKSFNSIVKTINIADMCIIHLWYTVMVYRTRLVKDVLYCAL